MGKNTSVSLGDHFESFVEERVKTGRYASASDAVRAGLRLLEQEESKLDLLRETLAKGESQLDQGQGLDGEEVFKEIIDILHQSMEPRLHLK
jgi:antitoxin ParD1/3/4